ARIEYPWLNRLFTVSSRPLYRDLPIGSKLEMLSNSGYRRFCWRVASVAPGTYTAGLICRVVGRSSAFVPVYAAETTRFPISSRWMLTFHCWAYPDEKLAGYDVTRTGRLN